MREACAHPRPVREDGRVTPKTFFSIFAVGEALTWALLLAGMFLKYVTRTTEALVSVGGALHGFMFLAFIVATVYVGVSQKWRVGRVLLGLLSAIIPFATVPFEVVVTRRGGLEGGWRLGRGGDEPAGAAEAVVSWTLHRPVVSVVAGLVVVGGVFTALMLSGPPV
jgi:integral membrane protein